MNEQLVEERARRRMANAELAEVLEVPIAVIVDDDEPGVRHAGWVAAAVVVLGVAVAVGVALARGLDDAPLQDPAPFDPVFPTYDVKELLRPGPIVGSVAALAFVPPVVDSICIDPFNEGGALLDAVVSRRGVRKLSLEWNGQAPRESTWRDLGKMQDLRVLALPRRPGVRAEQLRELRAAPRLTSLLVPLGESAFDRELGQAIAELPRLRSLALVNWEFAGTVVTPEGIEALSSLPDLEWLMVVGVDDPEGELMRSIATLRRLRFLLIERRPRGSLSPDEIAELAKLPCLQMLDLSHASLDEHALRRLPQQLQSLALAGLSGVTPDGIASLARLPRLRSLTFRAGIPVPLDAAVAELITKLPLEHFGCLVGVPSPALWQALEGQPKLRGLALPGQGAKGLADVLNRCAKLRGLERLTLDCRDGLKPDELAPLRGHPTLRRIDLERFPVPPANADDLRACLGPDVEVVFRW